MGKERNSIKLKDFPIFCIYILVLQQIPDAWTSTNQRSKTIIVAHHHFPGDDSDCHRCRIGDRNLWMATAAFCCQGSGRAGPTPLRHGDRGARRRGSASCGGCALHAGVCTPFACGFLSHLLVFVALFPIPSPSRQKEELFLFRSRKRGKAALLGGPAVPPPPTGPGKRLLLLS